MLTPCCLIEDQSSYSGRGIGSQSDHIQVEAAEGGWEGSESHVGGTMDDLIYLTLMVFFFLLALAYVHGCEKLQ